MSQELHFFCLYFPMELWKYATKLFLQEKTCLASCKECSELTDNHQLLYLQNLPELSQEGHAFPGQHLTI